MLQKTEKIWFNGQFVPWEEANVHVLTHTLHYGLGVFEGIRCYKCSDGTSAVFRLEEHVARLFDSAQIACLDMPFTRQEIFEAILNTIRVNNLEKGYIRPMAFLGTGAMGLFPGDNPVSVVIAVWPWGAYLGDEALVKGVAVKTSSFTRHQVNCMMTKAKINGNYVNSILAKREALNDGYDEALMLDSEGYCAEATGENIFCIKNSVLKTPPLDSVLPGITRDCLMTMARDMEYQVVEQRFSRDELYVADEAFFCGTAAELTPIRKVDRRTIGAGEAGPVTRLLQQEFFNVVSGDNLKYAGWLTQV